MSKNIEIDLNSKANLLDRYNEEKVSYDLVKYIIKQAEIIKPKEDVKIIINKKCKIEEDCEKLIKDGLEEEYYRSMENYHSNNKKQMVFLVLGTIVLFIATLMKGSVWKDIVIISGWVPIWKMVEIELIPDVYGRRKRRIIRKLLKSEILEKKV